MSTPAYTETDLDVFGFQPTPSRDGIVCPTLQKYTRQHGTRSRRPDERQVDRILGAAAQSVGATDASAGAGAERSYDEAVSDFAKTIMTALERDEESLNKDEGEEERNKHIMRGMHVRIVDTSRPTRPATTTTATRSSLLSRIFGRKSGPPVRPVQARMAGDGDDQSDKASCLTDSSDAETLVDKSLDAAASTRAHTLGTEKAGESHIHASRFDIDTTPGEPVVWCNQGPTTSGGSESGSGAASHEYTACAQCVADAKAGDFYGDKSHYSARQAAYNERTRGNLSAWV
jgi:hypothetical protein